MQIFIKNTQAAAAVITFGVYIFPSGRQTRQNAQPAVFAADAEYPLIIAAQSPCRRTRLPRRPALHIDRRVFEIAVYENVRFDRRPLARIIRPVRHDRGERSICLLRPSEHTVCHYFKTTRMIVNAAVFVDPRQHAAHPPHAHIVLRIGRHAQPYAFGGNGFVHRPQKRLHPLLRHYPRHDRKRLRINIERTVFIRPVSDRTARRKSAYIIISVPRAGIEPICHRTPQRKGVFRKRFIARPRK